MMIEKIFLVLIFLFSVFFGLFLYLKPMAAFEFQRRFYEKINWKIEPVSLEKEIRNTRIMGIALILFVLAVAIYGLLR